MNITAVDVGSAKICVILATIKEKLDKIEIKGYSEVKSKGIKNGIVNSITNCSNAVKEAIDKAVENREIDLGKLYVTFSGEHIRNRSSKAIISFEQSKEINQKDINVVISNAINCVKAEEIDKNTVIIEGLPRSFSVDSLTNGSIDPLGLTANTLEVDLNVFLANKNIKENLSKCFERLNYKVDYFQPISLATSFGVLNKNDTKYGCLLLDIGAETINITSYNSYGIMDKIKVIPYGINNVKENLFRSGYSYDEIENLLDLYCKPITVQYEENSKDEVYVFRELIKKGYSKKDFIYVKEVMNIFYEKINNNLEEMFKDGSANLHKVFISGGGSLVKDIDYFLEYKMRTSVKIKFPILDKIFLGPVLKFNKIFFESPKLSAIIGLLNKALKDYKEKNDNEIEINKNNNIKIDKNEVKNNKSSGLKKLWKGIISDYKDVKNVNNEKDNDKDNDY